MAEKTRESRIKAETKRLMTLFAGLPANELAFLTPLIRNAAFMAVTLADLQVEINQDGTVDEYRNGAAQYGKKAAATLQAYNSTMKVYLATLDKLIARLPQEQRKSALADLMSGEDK